MRVTFNELAERELNDAAQYYEYEQPGLGAAFIVEVRRCTVAVAEHPQASPVVLGTIRRRLCQRFPYATSLHGCWARVAHSRGHEPETPSRILGWSVLIDGPTGTGPDAALVAYAQPC